MEMYQPTFEFLNKLSQHTIVISTLLGGFSITLVVSLLESNTSSRVARRMFRTAVVATLSFIIAIFAFTRILMMTTEGRPFPTPYDDIFFSRILGVLFFTLGLIAIIVVVGLSGWMKSKPMGRFTTILSVIALILTILMLV